MMVVVVNGCPVIVSVAVNTIETCNLLVPAYGYPDPMLLLKGNVAEANRLKIIPATCRYIELANAEYVNGFATEPSLMLPAAFSRVGPTSTDAAVMLSISMLIVIGTTGVIVWSTNEKSKNTSVFG